MKKIILLSLLLCCSLPALAQNPTRRRASSPYSQLGAPTDGETRYCSDCQATSPCASGGTGAVAERVAGAWNCSVGGGVSPSRTINTTSPITGGGNLSADRTIAIPVATSSVNGYLSSTDWSTFNNKQAALGFTPENSANKDAVSGYAGLDASTLLKAAEFPAFTGDATKPSGSLVTTVAKVNGNTPGGTCTNQFARSLSSSAVPSCATVALGTDVSGTLQAANFPALTGDITTSAGALATSLKSTGTAGTYRSVTFDAQGRETSGTNPTTFSGYGISDTSANLAAALTDESGSGLAIFQTSPTIITPTIASFTNATHNHTNAAGGGQLTISAFSSTTGSGAVVGATSPTLVTPVIGAATGTSLSVSGQLTSTQATGTAPLVITSTTPVANLTTVPVTYNAAGTQQTSVHVVRDTATLSSGTVTITFTGSAAFTSTSTYSCLGKSQSGSNVQETKNSGSSLTLNGTGAQVIDYICVGN